MPLRKINACIGGGFRALQQHLLQQKEEFKCDVCMEMLKKANFVASDLQEAMQARIRGEKMQPADGDVPEVLPDQNAEKTQPKRKKMSQGDEAADENDVGPAACKEYLQEFWPTIELLPPGSFNKKVPYRCTVCRSRHQPNGKVGDLVKMRLWSVKCFLQKHLDSQTHKDAVARKDVVVRDEEEAKMVPCEGLCINDEPTAGKLYLYRKEFELWASVANFESCAKHSYWHDGNLGSWFVRSASCDKTTLETPDMDRQTCGTCLQLGSSHGVSWLFLVQVYFFETHGTKIFPKELRLSFLAWTWHLRAIRGAGLIFEKRCITFYSQHPVTVSFCSFMMTAGHFVAKQNPAEMGRGTVWKQLYKDCLRTIHLSALSILFLGDWTCHPLAIHRARVLFEQSCATLYNQHSRKTSFCSWTKPDWHFVAMKHSACWDCALTNALRQKVLRRPTPQHEDVSGGRGSAGAHGGDQSFSSLQSWGQQVEGAAGLGRCQAAAVGSSFPPVRWESDGETSHLFGHGSQAGTLLYCLCHPREPPEHSGQVLCNHCRRWSHGRWPGEIAAGLFGHQGWTHLPPFAVWTCLAVRQTDEEAVQRNPHNGWPKKQPHWERGFADSGRRITTRNVGWELNNGKGIWASSNISEDWLWSVGSTWTSCPTTRSDVAREASRELGDGGSEVCAPSCNASASLGWYSDACSIF